MNLEQNLNGGEAIKNNESVQGATSFVSEGERLSKIGDKTQREEDIEKIEKIKADLGIQTEGKETKQEFSEGHIMNPQILNKIAQLEAIDYETLEFNQQSYDDYMNGQAKLGSYSVGENQKKIKEALERGKTIEKVINRLDPIFGRGGWNRYYFNSDGTVKLLRGATNTSGSPEYKAKLAQKAKELGISVEGQE